MKKNKEKIKETTTGDITPDMYDKEGYITLVGMDAHSISVSLCVTRWRKGEDPQIIKEFSTDLDGLESSYVKCVPQNAFTVLEASTNSFSIMQRLKAVGYKATIVNSDAISGMSRSDKVNDRHDARNLALAYSRGGTRKVYVPSPKYALHRDVWFGYRNAVKDTVRLSNRLWNFCSMHGLKLPKRASKQKIDGILNAIKDKAWDKEESFHIDIMLEDYVGAVKRRKTYEKKIEQTVATNPDMAHVMQVLGIRYIIAFALVAFIEDIKRFETSKKLVSYIGLNPSVCDSGTKEGVRHISRYGRRDLKSLMVEASQSAFRKGNAPMHLWARRKLASGKVYNRNSSFLVNKTTKRSYVNNFTLQV